MEKPLSSQHSLYPSGLAESVLADRALQLLNDPLRHQRLRTHRFWIVVCTIVGIVALIGALTMLKLEIAQSVQAERFMAFLSALGCMLLLSGLVLFWHTSSTERHLHRLAMLRLNLDSLEATAELLRMQQRLAIAKEECERLPEPRRGILAIEVLNALVAMEEDAGGTLAGSGDFAHRVVAAGMREMTWNNFRKGFETTSARISSERRRFRRVAA